MAAGFGWSGSRHVLFLNGRPAGGAANVVVTRQVAMTITPVPEGFAARRCPCSFGATLEETMHHLGRRLFVASLALAGLSFRSASAQADNVAGRADEVVGMVTVEGKEKQKPLA